MIYYCTYTMGGTSRGVGVLKALGEGVLVTPYRKIALAEQLPWFRHVPLPLDDDILIYDRISPFRDKGKRVTVDIEGDADLLLDGPIVSHGMDELDLDRAEWWWTFPIAGAETMPEERILACRGGRPRTVRDFEARARLRQDVRIITPSRRQWYWPAIELMALADEVIGERQVQNEWAVARGDADPDGAKRAAAEIRKLLRG